MDALGGLAGGTTTLLAAMMAFEQRIVAPVGQQQSKIECQRHPS